MRPTACPPSGRTRSGSIPSVSRRTQVERRPRFAFIPFAAGHRNCVGASAATVELKLAVAMIAQRYELSSRRATASKPRAGTTMHPRYGMKMRIRAL